MSEYKVFFTNGDTLTLTEEQFNVFQHQIFQAQHNFDSNISFVAVDVDLPFLVLNTILYIRRNTAEGISTVVTPPTPASLREEKKHEEATQDVTLDAQLDNPEVGK